ncbi:hypothetical protein SEUCBS139899_001746 [Sporothrix eucalyptigena]|uniref:Uncharacterized protein n=1 Tax=Sporothrix eucalyptigena TaxID=1812306 RepID=A0ABP0BWN2_9PEZI
MSVPLSRFWAALVQIQTSIATSHFVAIDLEMTGIEPRDEPRLQRLTKEQLYARAKKAAETFNVLQLGLTCIEYDSNTPDDGKMGRFILRSYNFNVSPMFDTTSPGGAVLARVVDRTLTLSYKTLMFLKQNRIRIEDSYDGGIPYLSRAEEEEAIPELFKSNSRSKSEKIDIEAQMDETKEFYRDVIQKIREWEVDPMAKVFLNIVNPHGGPMTRFQRRLVHQILETEFENKYIGLLKNNTFMQIVRRDDEEEQKLQEKMHDQRKQAVRAQRGLRYIIEALVGGNFAEDVFSMYDAEDELAQAVAKKLLRQSESILQGKGTPILVGHNMFLDLCFLYAAFFGPLPDTLDQFGVVIHKLFPRIMDTKHLLTHNDHEMMAPKILDGVFLEMENEDFPFTIEHYSSSTSGRHPANANHHQAGYDSYKTSVVFLKEMWKHAEDKFLASQVIMPDDAILIGGDNVPLQWDDLSFQKFANTVRIGYAGLWYLGKKEDGGDKR